MRISPLGPKAVFQLFDSILWPLSLRLMIVLACTDCASHVAKAAEIPTEQVAQQLRNICDQLKETPPLLAALGSDLFQDREQATMRLINMPVKPFAALHAMVAGPDPEKRVRARRILRHASEQTNHLKTLLDAIREQRLTGFASEILLLIEYAEDPDLRFVMQQALVTTAHTTDIPRFRQAAQNSHPRVRVAAAVALAQLSGPESQQVLLEMANDPHEQVRLALGDALAQRQQPECISILASLLLSNDRDVRTSAALTLHKVTGKNFGFFRCKNASERQAVVDRWQAWRTAQGDQLKLRTIDRSATTASPFD